MTRPVHPGSSRSHDPGSPGPHAPETFRARSPVSLWGVVDDAPPLCVSVGVSHDAPSASDPTAASALSPSFCNLPMLFICSIALWFIACHQSAPSLPPSSPLCGPICLFSPGSYFLPFFFGPCNFCVPSILLFSLPPELRVFCFNMSGAVP